MRRSTRKITVGCVEIGGGAPVSVQSMVKTRPAEIERTVAEVRLLESAGCEIVRMAVPDFECARAIKEIKKETRVPLVADIHFNYKLAVEAAAAGADKIRLNPGNIFRQEEIERVAAACMERGIPVRAGINSGSLRPGPSGKKTHALMAEEALSYCGRLEKAGLRDIAVSLKASDVRTAVDAYRLFSETADYPLHLGVTAAGTRTSAGVKSSVCMGILLSEGIGDTIRVSLTGPPAEEVKIGFEILSALGLRKKPAPDIISCPACGRCRVDLEAIAGETEKRIEESGISGKLAGVKIAIMGCEVNGPGEAGEADVGLACGAKSALLFRKGRIHKKIGEAEAVQTLLNELKIMAGGN